jgi:hypothetical protein
MAPYFFGCANHLWAKNAEQPAIEKCAALQEPGSSKALSMIYFLALTLKQPNGCLASPL